MGNFRQEQQRAGEPAVSTTEASGHAVLPPQQISARTLDIGPHPSSSDQGSRRLSSGSSVASVGANPSGQHRSRSGSASHQRNQAPGSGDSPPTSGHRNNSTTGSVGSGLRDQMSVEDTRRTIRGTWPNNVVAFLSCMSCVLGMYNISRFSLLVYVYKGSFLLQFLILSIVIGLPFLHLLMTLGQFLGSGIVDMWYISPAFKGIGFAIIWSYFVLGVYSAVPISWLFVYFRDSFITTRESYKWAICQPKYAAQSCIHARNTSSPDILGWTVSSYYHGRVLDRKLTQDHQIGEVKFEIAFHLGVVWLLVFICLSRGLRSLSKVMYVLGTLPLILFLLISIRFMEQWGEGVATLFTTTWQPFMTDSMSWQVAAREVMWTWGVFGAAVLNICSHNKPTFNVTKNLVIMIFLTLVVLLMGSFFFASTAFVLNKRGLIFVPSSYEEEYSGKFLMSTKNLLPAMLNISTSNLYMGNQLVSTEFMTTKLSGYEVLRFATEVFPAALAVEGVLRISSFWSISFYLVFILMALAQQLLVWHCVVESVVSLKPKILRAWQSVITFISCNVAFLFGLPMTTNIGIFIMYFFDFCFGSLWWLVIIYLIMLIAVLFIRGRPYGTDQLVAVLVKQHSIRGWLLPVLTFQWNVVLPLSFLVTSIAFVRAASVEGISWTEEAENYHYWPRWVKKLSIFMQLWPLLIIAIVGAIQAVRFLSPKHPQPLHERVQALCCPVVLSPSSSSNSIHGGASSQQANEGMVNSAFVDDPPPKYTPPPSYSTATARIIAQQVREHIGGFSGLSAAGQSAPNRATDTCLPTYSQVYLVSYDPKLETNSAEGVVTSSTGNTSAMPPVTNPSQCQI